MRSLSQFLLTKPVPILAVFWPVFRSMDSGFGICRKAFLAFFGLVFAKQGPSFLCRFRCRVPRIPRCNGRFKAEKAG
ncbi:MAG: hypothetical protein C6W57_03195 [Caldibacillus debilis]|nr:MAG: hypothetical protein BAA03_15550 [Caldibacillus debilis]REJ18630.1 MAG: hypothetical protein C6W57_03195 [Caldibacillus debilis]